MLYSIKLEHSGFAYSLEEIEAGSVGLGSLTGFVTSEDGEKLVKFLEGMERLVLAPAFVPGRLIVASIPHVLAIFHRNATATVYVNELTFLSKIQVKRDVEAGGTVSFDDIADIQQLQFMCRDQGVDVPRECGVMFYFTHGWRRGFFYDSSPLVHPHLPREYDIGDAFARCLVHLAFRERIGVLPTDMKALREQGWFPFISLKSKTVQAMIAKARKGRPIEDLLGQITSETQERIRLRCGRFDGNPLLADHAQVLDKAAEHYLGGDWMSAALILYPRIEGVLRSHYQADDRQGKVKTRKLIKAATTGNPKLSHGHSLLLPESFETYLSDVPFEDFDETSPEGSTRHTIAHGVAPPEALDERAATIGFLILEQLSYCIAPSETPPRPK